MPRARRLLLTAMIPIAAIGLATVGVIASAQDRPSSEWLTWGYDQERTGWNKGENTLSPENVSRLELKWEVQLSTKPQEVLPTLTAPLGAENVKTAQGTKTSVFVIGSDDTLFAIDAHAGEVVWQKGFVNNIPPSRPATLECSNTQNADRRAKRDHRRVQPSSSTTMALHRTEVSWLFG
jgi:glucose dehydrogenase